MDIDISAIDRFEAALHRAAARFAERAIQPVLGGAVSDDAVLQNLGIQLGGCFSSAEPASAIPAGPSPIIEGLGRENARLIRMARRACPAYDLNRHLAVRRLLNRWLGPAAGTRETPAKPRSVARDARFASRRSRSSASDRR